MKALFDVHTLSFYGSILVHGDRNSRTNKVLNVKGFEGVQVTFKMLENVKK